MPKVPPVTTPVEPSITTASTGATLKVKAPPTVPEIDDIPPSQVGAIVNVASSKSKDITLCVEVTEQRPGVT